MSDNLPGSAGVASSIALEIAQRILRRLSFQELINLGFYINAVTVIFV